MKYLHHIIILICAFVIGMPLQAQTLQSNFRSTSSYHTSYQLPSIDSQTTPIYNDLQFANGSIRTAASSLNGTLADESGYIPTTPSGVTGPQRSIAPPISAPLNFGWDVILLILFLSLLYAYKIHRKTKTTN